MLGPLGLPELLVILALVLIVFGAGKLPDVMSSMGQGVREFRKASEGDFDGDDSGAAAPAPKPAAAAKSAAKSADAQAATPEPAAAGEDQSD